MPFASALSVHPVTAIAVGEAAGQVLEAVGPSPDLACVFVTPHHAGALEDVGRTLAAVLSPNVLYGCAGVAVVGVGQEVEDDAGVVVWAGRFGSVAPFTTGSAPAFDPSALVLLADPFSFDAEAFFAQWPDVPVVGGLASAARGPGGNRLLSGTAVSTAGAVGAWLGPGVSVDSVVSQGCRRVGSPWVVTKAERNIVYELGGVPALERLTSMVKDGMAAEDVLLINEGLHLGLVIDEHKAEFGPGDFLVRNVLGGDRSNGAIAVGAEVEVGMTVQFHVRDAATADEDLHAALAGRQAAGALMFTCNGRGRRLFGKRHHDARVFEELVGAPVAGFFAAGEFGPVGGRTFVHGFTASLALFHS